jgi:hypothetical protein
LSSTTYTTLELGDALEDIAADAVSDDLDEEPLNQLRPGKPRSV